MSTLNNSANIKVIGVGGGGVNAVDRMIQSGVAGVDFIAVNTDTQSLTKSDAETKLDIGREISNGLGAGADPTVGRRAAEENQDMLRSALEGADMVFVAAGEGGGTGTGAAPIIARIARELGALTVAVVTRPFSFEGRQRMRNAVEGIAELRQAVDTLIVIPNDRLVETTSTNLSVMEAFQLADEVLLTGVKGISDLIQTAGYVNTDFADVKAVMKDAGTAIMGIGTASGADRALQATENAISSPLLEAKINGAHAVLLAFTASTDFGILELQQAAELVQNQVDPDANIIFGMSIDETLGDAMTVTVIAAGFNEEDDYLLAEANRKPGQAKPVAAAAPVAPVIPPVVEDVPAARPTVSGIATPADPRVAAEPVRPSTLDVPPTIDEGGFDLDLPSFLLNDN